MSAPWMFEMSKHSMRRGSTSRSSRSCRARRISWDCWRGCFHSRSKASRALRTTSSSRRTFSPRCGTRIADVRAPPLREPRLEQLAVGDLLRHQHLARHVAARRRRTAGWSMPRSGLGLGQRGRAGSPRAPPPCRRAPRRPARAARSPSTWAPKRSRSSRSVVVIFCGASRRSSARHLVAQAGRLLEASSAAAVSICGRSRRTTSSVRPSRKSRASSHACAVAVERADLGHAGREAALDLVLQAGPRPLAVRASPCTSGCRRACARGPRSCGPGSPGCRARRRRCRPPPGRRTT